MRRTIRPLVQPKLRPTYQIAQRIAPAKQYMASGFLGGVAPEGPPLFTSESSSQFVMQNAGLQLSVFSPNADSYQWYRNGTVLAGATDRMIDTASAQRTDAGLYWCVATNGEGSTESRCSLVMVAEQDPMAQAIDLYGTGPSSFARGSHSAALPGLLVGQRGALGYYLTPRAGAPSERLWTQQAHVQANDNIWSWGITPTLVESRVNGAVDGDGTFEPISALGLLNDQTYIVVFHVERKVGGYTYDMEGNAQYIRLATDHPTEPTWGIVGGVNDAFPYFATVRKVEHVAHDAMAFWEVSEGTGNTSTERDAGLRTITWSNAIWNQVTVPDVVDTPIATARSTIIAADLVVGTETPVSHPTIVVDNVVSQDPVATTVVEQGTAVDLEVSTGPESNISPTTDVDPAPNQVAEDAAPGTPIGVTAQATDPPFTITYSLTADYSGAFQINGSSGVVTVLNNTPLVYPNVATITILSTSSGGTTSSLVVSDISILQQASNISTLTDSDPATNEVKEDANINTPVGVTLLATDGPYTVTYELTDNDAGGFKVDANTGVVTVNSSAGWTYPGTRNFTGRGNSSGGTSTAPTQFSVALLQRDSAVTTPIDNDPAANEVSEVANAGATVGITLLSTDRPGDTISYSLEAQTPAGAFTVGTTTGVVTVVTSANLTYPGTASITGKATSSGGTEATALPMDITILEDTGTPEPTIPGIIEPRPNDDIGCRALQTSWIGFSHAEAWRFQNAPDGTWHIRFGYTLNGTASGKVVINDSDADIVCVHGSTATANQGTIQVLTDYFAVPGGVDNIRLEVVIVITNVTDTVTGEVWVNGSKVGDLTASVRAAWHIRRWGGNSAGVDANGTVWHAQLGPSVAVTPGWNLEKYWRFFADEGTGTRWNAESSDANDYSAAQCNAVNLNVDFDWITGGVQM